MGRPHKRPESGEHPLRNLQRERYCLGRMQGLSKSDAYVEAGYVGDPDKGGRRLDNRAEVIRRVQWLRQTISDRVVTSAAVTRSEIIEDLRDNRRLAKKTTPIMDKDGNVVGETRPDLSAGNRANEILAKMHGFMLDVTRQESLDEELEGKDPEELKSFVLSLLEQLDPNMRKQLVMGIEDPDDEADLSPERVLQ